MGVTEEETLRIHQALSDAGGDREKASIALEMTWPKLTDEICGCPALLAVWGKVAVAAPTAEDVGSVIEFSEAAVPIEVKPTVRFVTGLKKLGLTEDEVSMAVSLQEFHNRHFTQSVDIVGGCVTVTALKLKSKLDELDSTIRAGFADDKGVWDTGREAMCWETYLKIADQFRKMAAMSNDVAMKKALVKLKEKQSRDGAGRSAKPAFSPMLAQKSETHIHAQSGSTIVLEKHGQAKE